MEMNIDKIQTGYNTHIPFRTLHFQKTVTFFGIFYIIKLVQNHMSLVVSTFQVLNTYYELKNDINTSETLKKTLNMQICTFFNTF